MAYTLDGYEKKRNSDKNQRDNLRWSDFNIVSDRLNAPEIFDIFINNYINYRTYFRDAYKPSPTWHISVNSARMCYIKKTRYEYSLWLRSIRLFY